MNRICACMALTMVAALAASCGREPPAVTTVIQTVDRPVAVPCLRPGQRPIQPGRLSEPDPTPPGTLTEMVGQLRAKLMEWQDIYGPTADDLMVNCERLPQP